MDAVVVHSEHGAARLRDELGVDGSRVRVIPHGAFDYLTRLPEERSEPHGFDGARREVCDRRGRVDRERQHPEILDHARRREARIAGLLAARNE